MKYHVTIEDTIGDWPSSALRVVYHHPSGNKSTLFMSDTKTLMDNLRLCKEGWDSVHGLSN